MTANGEYAILAATAEERKAALTEAAALVRSEIGLTPHAQRDRTREAYAAAIERLRIP